MNVKTNRKNLQLERLAEPDERGPHLLHRAGSIGSGLFPAWGPKL